MNFLELELYILKLFNYPISPTFSLFVVFFTFSIYGALLLLTYHFFRKKEKRFVHLVATTVFGYLFVFTLKYAINRPRPYVLFPNIIPTSNFKLLKPDPAFPSGHTFLAFLLLRFLPKKIPKLIRGLLVIYLLAIPIGTLYLAIHYPSDVIAGALIGWFFPKILSEELSTKLIGRITKVIRSKKSYLTKVLSKTKK